MSLGTNISRLRAEHHLSQGDLAEALAVSSQSVSKWETDSSVPDLDKLVKLSQVFGVTLDELVTGADGTSPRKEDVANAPVESLLGRRLSVREKLRIGVGLALLLFWVAELVYYMQLGIQLWWFLSYTLPLLLCGLICLFLRKRTVFWCCWVLYLRMDWFFRSASSVNWKVVLHTIGYEPTWNYLRLATSWGLFLGMLMMLFWTLATFRNASVPAILQKRGRLLLCWVVYWIVGLSVFLIQGIRTEWNGHGYPYNDIYADWPLLLIFTVLLTITFCSLRSRKRHLKGTP